MRRGNFFKRYKKPHLFPGLASHGHGTGGWGQLRRRKLAGASAGGGVVWFLGQQRARLRGLEAGRHGRRVVVLSLEVGDHFRILAVVVSEPEQVVDALQGPAWAAAA